MATTLMITRLKFSKQETTMSLVLALKNRDSVVVASDSTEISDGSLKYGQFLNLSGRTIQYE